VVSRFAEKGAEPMRYLLPRQACAVRDGLRIRARKNTRGPVATPAGHVVATYAPWGHGRLLFGLPLLGISLPGSRA